MVASVGYACLSGQYSVLVQAALEGTQRAVMMTISLTGGYMFFCGLIEIAKAMRFEKGLQKMLAPVLKRLMPYSNSENSRGAVALNLAMNMLGIGNAATPAGIEAMRLMNEERSVSSSVRHDMEMFLILNATSLQLLPTTVLTMRMAAGSANAGVIVWPTLLCTLFSTTVGAKVGVCCRKWLVKRDAE